MIEKALYREIEIIENDDNLTFEEKQREICKLEQEAREYEKEATHEEIEYRDCW